MNHRGRGCLEVKESPNPFFQTTNADIGVNPNKKIEWTVDGKSPPFLAKQHNVDGNFAFLYTRTSDEIGSKVKKPEMRETRLLTKTEFLKKKREEFHSTESLDEILHEDAPIKRTAENVLAVYKHVPKEEDPRYTTSSAEYGKKLPSVATLVVDRASKPQDFSKSFQNLKPQNTSLTTSITRSTVHKSLDPQFA